jgi:predicted ATPase
MNFFVGREPEIAKLGQYFEEAKQGLGKIVFISAEPGCGKTTLVRKFLADLDPIAVISGVECIQPNRSMPFLPFQEILAELTSDTTSFFSGDRKLKRDIILTVLREAGPNWLGMIPVVGDAIAAGITTTISLKQQLSKKNLANTSKDPEDILLNFDHELRKMAIARKQPLVVFIDDLHWIDPSSCDLLFGLAKKLKSKPYPLLLIGTYRPDDIHAEKGHPMQGVLDNLRSYTRNELHIDRCDQWLVEIDLKRFGQKEVDSLMSKRFPCNAFPDDFSRNLMEITGGNPMFVSGIFELLVENGQIIDLEGVWRLKTEEISKLPRSIEGLINARLGKIGKDLRRVLECASVHGQDFTVQIIQNILKEDEMQLWEELNDLQLRHGLIVAGGTSVLPQVILDFYHFTHVLYRKYLYDSLQPGQRRAYHRQIALVMQQIYGDRIETDDYLKSQLNQHIQIANGMLDAMTLKLTNLKDCQIDEIVVLEQAQAELDLAKSLHVQHAMLLCLEHCNNSIGFTEIIKPRTVESNLIRFKALVIAIEVQIWQALYDDAEKSVKQLQSITERQDDDGLRAQVFLLQGKIEHARGMYALEMTYLHKALSMAQGTEKKDLQAECYVSLGVASDRRAQYQECINYFEKAIEIYKLLNDKQKLARCYNSMGVANRSLGAYKEAFNFYNMAIELSKQIDDQELVGDIANSLGFYYSHHGLYQQAFDYYSQALKISIDFGDRKRMSRYYNNAGFMLQKLKRYEESMEYHQTALQISEDLNDPLGIALNNASIAKLFQKLGKFEESYNHLLKAITLAQGQENKLKLAIRYNSMGLLLVEMKRFDEALEYFFKSLEINEETKNVLKMAENFMSIGKVYHAQSDAQNALINFGKAYDLFCSVEENDKNLAEAEFQLGMAYQLAGNITAMQIEIGKAKLRYDRLGNEDRLKQIANFENM